jgi:GNAT superfamily N-acetyltransferase
VTIAVRPVQPADAALVVRFILALAKYERLEAEAVVTEADMARDLFGSSPRVFCDIAELDGQPIGFALWFYTYSTFLGRHGIWLEDLFVDPQARGQGAGKAMLRELARRSVAEGLGRLEWNVLDWNAPSIAFYEAQGAKVTVGEWRQCRLTGDALRRMAGQ